MKYRYLHLSLFFVLCFFACQPADDSSPLIGFADAFEDETIGQAREGFVAALAEHGFSENDKTIRIQYRNAQGDIPTLTQIVNYFISEKVDLIASNTTLATITAIQRTSEIPVFMMVSPEPSLINVVDDAGDAPKNLFGVAESLDYIDTAFALIPEFVKPKKDQIVIGMVYNQSEPQSVNALERMRENARQLGVVIEALPLNNSAEAQLVTTSLLDKGIDAFFANPDNTVFAAFETIVKNCNEKNVPIFTSESGLVERGAVAAFGADIYAWGYQAGIQAAKFLEGDKVGQLAIERVKVRKRVFNPDAAKHFGYTFPEGFEAI